MKLLKDLVRFICTYLHVHMMTLAVLRYTYEPTDSLNVYNATQRGAVKLVMRVFTDKPQAQPKRKKEENKVNTTVHVTT